MQIAQLIKADVGLEVAFADVGGWDTTSTKWGQPSVRASSRTCWAISDRRWRRSSRTWATAWPTSAWSP